MKYSVITFGCRVNQADSLAIEEQLSAGGAEAVSADRADLVIVNTCSVTASADQGARQTIRRIARENPAARIIATGCYATRCADDVAALPGVAKVVPNDRKLSIPIEFVALSERQRVEGHCGHLLAPGLMGRTAWTLRVQTGCEERCSYCIIPTTRGRSRSRELGDVLNEVDRVVDAGYKEIVITGVHLGSYGRDLKQATSLACLLENLLARTALGRRSLGEGGRSAILRISSLEPMDFPSEIVERVAPHFHLPLQHASNRMLSAMRRPYTIERYAAIVDDIRARVPHAAIGTDVIVGFPGETDDDFDALTTYLETSPLTHIHVFPYSDRPGTEASAMAGKVHGSVIKERGARIREISRTLQERFRASLGGSRRPALTIEDGSIAVTDNYIRVPAPAGHGRNEWVEVTL
jgi:threonylcarbamoyladenosine tRNA methylthiotransferase MtaB